MKIKKVSRKNMVVPKTPNNALNCHTLQIQLAECATVCAAGNVHVSFFLHRSTIAVSLA